MPHDHRRRPTWRIIVRIVDGKTSHPVTALDLVVLLMGCSIDTSESIGVGMLETIFVTNQHHILAGGRLKETARQLSSSSK